jgi:hypothetical protein
MKMADKKYLNIPLDEETYKKVKTLAQAKGFGARGQGAIVRALVNAEYEKWASEKLLGAVTEQISTAQQA